MHGYARGTLAGASADRLGLVGITNPERAPEHIGLLVGLHQAPVDQPVCVSPHVTAESFMQAVTRVLLCRLQCDLLPHCVASMGC